MVGDSGTPALSPARQQMQERVNEVLSKARATIKELGKDPPKIIYHYTNADGLLGILGSNRLWATNAFYVNDTSEIVYCADVIGKAIDEQLKRFPSDESTELARRLRETVNMFGLVLEPYIVCFCEKSDLLSQWRAYSGGPGGGYALGIETQYAGMDFTTRSPNQTFDLIRVVYDENEQLQRIDDLIAPVWAQFDDIWKSLGSKAAEEVMPWASRGMRDALFYYFVAFKSPVFREEQEWRFVHISALKAEKSLLRFRTVGSLVAPYIALNPCPPVGEYTGRVPLAELVCGPNNHPQQTVKAVRMALDALGHPGVFVNVRLSEVPLRV